jgi:cyclic beta-1,2-glucan synthetase
MIQTIESLQKWNGHLYNWYSTKTKEPLQPRYISTVDSGNFVGYLYVVKSFLEEILEKDIDQEKINNLVDIVKSRIDETDFSKLYSYEHQIFSIGFNVEEGKLTDSYYDLLASEARQASIVAIAKKDVPSKHWNHLSRTLTVLGKYKGLISWSGTAFEYLMPNINIPRYEGSLLDESCKFMIKSQMEYARRLNLPWGISEAAFNLKDLQSNYQYKAFGIPWLGIKRGLADEMVVSAYGGILAISDMPKEVVKNLIKGLIF